jgi:hypothetical protein
LVIEQPTIDDLDEIMEVSRVWYDSMEFDDCGKHFDPETIKALWKDSLLSPLKYDVLVARENNSIIGAFGIVYQTTHTWFKGILQGYELVFHADPRLPKFMQGKIMLKLLATMLPIMQTRNADAVFVGCDARYPEVMEMLIRKGGRLVTNTVMFKF